jgi:hypothetical protein
MSKNQIMLYLLVVLAMLGCFFQIAHARTPDEKTGVK